MLISGCSWEREGVLSGDVILPQPGGGLKEGAGRQKSVGKRMVGAYVDVRW